MFERFDARIRGGADVTFPATIVGRFFAGIRQPAATGVFWGYGHLGCCSLLVIQQVVSVDGAREGRVR